MVGILTLVDPLSPNLDLGPDEVTIEQLPVVNTADLPDILPRQNIIHLAGILATLLLKCHFAKVKNHGRHFEGIVLFRFAEAKRVKGIVGKLQLFIVINRINPYFALE